MVTLWWIVGLTVLATIATTIVYANLKSKRRLADPPEWVSWDVESADLERCLEAILGPPLTERNDVVAMTDGSEILEVMLSSIRRARRHVHFETYIFTGDRIGQGFIDALAERGEAGVEVRVIVDWAGTGNFSDRQKQQLDDAGVLWEFYRPLGWYHLNRVNHRTHRKILVVDGKEAFVGGIGISALWPDEDYRDLHFRVTGPAVNRIQGIFADNWMKTHGKVLAAPAFFPEPEPAGEAAVQAFKSSGDPNSESVRLAFAMLIASARKTIKIGTPYFVPDEALLGALVEAVRRGVEVEVVVPGDKTDSDLARRASRATWGRLLAGGVKIYEYQPSFYHSKMLLVDDEWASVGSANFDQRSFMFNDENNINVRSRKVVAELAAIFAEDKARSEPIDLPRWRSRPWRERVEEVLARVVSSQL